MHSIFHFMHMLTASLLVGAVSYASKGAELKVWLAQSHWNSSGSIICVLPVNFTYFSLQSDYIQMQCDYSAQLVASR